MGISLLAAKTNMLPEGEVDCGQWQKLDIALHRCRLRDSAAN